MDFLTVITGLLNKHEADLAELAGYEVNSKTIKVTLQLNRLRTAEEQKQLLQTYYTETLETLKELDETGSYNFPIISQTIHQSTYTTQDLTALARRFGSLAGITGQTSDADFEGMSDAPLNAITPENPFFEILSNYKEYLVEEKFLEWVKEVMDLLEGHSGSDKVEAQPIEQPKESNSNVPALTTAQKVLALSYLLRWAGITLSKGQAARHQRFIAALTGLGAGTVKEKFPSARVEDRPNHLQNLKALIPLFESVNASDLVKRIQKEIAFEQEERD